MKERSDVDPQSRHVQRRRRSPHAGDTSAFPGPQAAAPEGRAGRAALRACHEQVDQAAQGRRVHACRSRRRRWSSTTRAPTFQAMTFNGSVPGPMMVVHEGDYVELTLINPDTNTMPHNIDFHAATGALGGGALTLVNPGEQVKLRFKATRTGVFVYHCAPGRPDDPLARRVGHERHHHGAAARRPEGRQGQAAQLRPGLLCRRAATSTSRATRTATSRPTRSAGDAYADTLEVMEA